MPDHGEITDIELVFLVQERDHSDYGHDLARDLNDDNVLWVSTNGSVYSFNKTTEMLTDGPGGATGINKTMVKAISRQNSSIFVLTRPDSEKTTELTR